MKYPKKSDDLVSNDSSDNTPNQVADEESESEYNEDFESEYNEIEAKIDNLLSVMNKLDENTDLLMEQAKNLLNEIRLEK